MSAHDGLARRVAAMAATGGARSQPVLEGLEPRLLLSTISVLDEAILASDPALAGEAKADASSKVADVADRLIGPMPAPLLSEGSLGRPPSGGAVFVPHRVITDYDWWYGCSPTTGGLHASWWDDEVQLWDPTYTTFPGDPSAWLFNIYPSSNPADFVVPAHANGVVNGWAHASGGDTWEGHVPDSIGDFMLTVDGGSYSDEIEWGMQNVMAWDDLRTPENESWSVTTNAPAVWNYEVYKTEIDAGRPVHLWWFSPYGGHSVLGVGYYDPDGPGGQEWVELYTTWHQGLQEWEWTNETQSGYGFTCDGGLFMDVLPQATGLTGYYAVEHTDVSDLMIAIGLGDPASPLWETTVWSGGGGTEVNLVRTDIDLSGALPFLSASEAWYLEVSDNGAGDQGTIMDFQVRDDTGRRFTFGGGTAIVDFQTAYAYIADGVDLRGESFSADPVHLTGVGTTAVTFEVGNAGNEDAAGFDIAFYFSDDPDFGNGDEIPATLVPSDPHYDPASPNVYHVPGGLLAGQSVADAIAIAVPSGDPFGTDGLYYLGMVVDAGHDVAEYSEANNHSQGVDVDLVAVDWLDFVYLADMNTNPGWTLQGEWAWGVPTGGGSHGFDPTAGYTGTHVIGYNLNGDYPDNLPVRYATTPAIDCTGYDNIILSFYRWLGVESASWDHATIQVSNNGTAWTTVWDHTGSSFSETSWSLQEYDISAVADGQPTVYLRWTMGPTDSSVTYPGWNLDDVTLKGTPTALPTRVRGTKFYDADQDGEREGGEPGLAGWRIYADLNDDGHWLAGEPFGITLADGSYTIALDPGVYAIREEAQSGWTQTFPADSHTVAVDLGQTVGGIDFGNYGLGGIRGIKWFDADRDGTQDPGETGLAGWTIYADLDGDGRRDDGEPFDLTDASGDYALTGLMPGTYTVAEELPAYWEQTYPGGAGTHTVAVAAGQVTEGVDFGNYGGSLIRGTKFYDADQDHVYDMGTEPGLAGWTIYADVDGNHQYTAGEPYDVTDAQGNYAIVIAPGTYVVAEVLQANWTQTYPLPGWPHTVTIGLGEVVDGIHFGNFAVGQIQGTKWLDADRDGTRDPGEPVLAGWKIYADANGDGQWQSGEPFGISGPDGSYSITVMPGTHIVGEVLQDGWEQTAPGGAGAYVVTVAARQTVTGIHFGNFAAATIRGGKWYDADQDGIWDAAEPGLPDWTVFLDLNGNGILDGGSRTVSSTDVPKSILDYTTTTSTLLVSGGGSLTDVNVTLNITHTYDADLDAYLVSPSGTAVELFSYVGGSGDNFINTTLDDEAATAIAVGTAPFTGKYRPEGLLADFDGEDPNGTWTLRVHDAAGGDQGTLTGWSIAIETGEPSRQTGPDGRYAFTDLAPGTYQVREVAQAGWTQTYPLPGGGHTVVVDVGVVAADVDFGNYAAGEIRGSKWFDADQDGERDPGEPGLAGWKIYADLDRDRQWDDGEPFDLTDPAGDYALTGLMPGSYRIGEVLRDGWEQTYPVTTGYLEDFSDGLAQDWLAAVPANWSVVAGEYRAAAGTTDVLMQSFYTGQTWQDCTAEVVMSRTGEEYSAAVLVVRASDDFDWRDPMTGSGYMIGISNNGDYYVAKVVSGTLTWLQEWAASPYLNTGATPNTVQAAVQGSAIEVRFNGNLAWSGSDTGIPGAGRVGLLAYSGSESETISYFDDVCVTSGAGGGVTAGFHAVTLGANQVVEDVDFGNYGQVSPPTAPDLLIGSDTGYDPVDDITRLDNSDPSKTLQFGVGDTIPGATVVLWDYLAGLAISVPVIATGPITIITTNGAYDLVDGAHPIVATQALGGLPSAESEALLVHVDTVAPRVTAFGVSSTQTSWALGTVDSSVWTTGRSARTAPWSRMNRFVVDFDEPVVSVSGDLTVVGATSGPVSLSGPAGTGTDRLTWTSAALLAKDRYQVRLASGPFTVADLAGNLLDGESGTDQFPSGDGVAGGDWLFSLNVLVADVSRGDGVVNVLDKARVRLCYGAVLGDANYDPLVDVNGDGVINVIDKALVRLRYGDQLPPITVPSRAKGPVKSAAARWGKASAGTATYGAAAMLPDLAALPPDLLQMPALFRV